MVYSDIPINNVFQLRRWLLCPMVKLGLGQMWGLRLKPGLQLQKPEFTNLRLCGKETRQTKRQSGEVQVAAWKERRKGCRTPNVLTKGHWEPQCLWKYSSLQDDFLWDRRKANINLFEWVQGSGRSENCPFSGKQMMWSPCDPWANPQDSPVTYINQWHPRTARIQSLVKSEGLNIPGTWVTQRGRSVPRARDWLPDCRAGSKPNSHATSGPIRENHRPEPTWGEAWSLALGSCDSFKRRIQLWFTSWFALWATCTHWWGHDLGIWALCQESGD